MYRATQFEVNGEKHLLEFKSIEDSFKFGEPPTVVVGISTAGKTTIAVDIIYKHCNTAKKIYYVSSTKDTVGDDVLSCLPSIFKRKPSYQNISNIWQEIKETNDCLVGATTNVLNQLIAKIYPSEAVKIIDASHRKYAGELTDTLQAEYSKQGMDKNEIPGAIGKDIRVWTNETLTRLVLAGVEKYGTNDLTEDDLGKIHALKSTSQETILIIDDVTAELDSMRAITRKVNYNGNAVPMQKAYKSVLTDILTRGRHYNCITVIFVHTLSIFDNKTLMSNFAFLNATAVDEFCRLKSVTEMMRSKTKAAAEVVFTRDDRYKYHFILVKDEGKNISVGKADLHHNEPLDLSDMTNKIVETCKTIDRGMIVAGNEDDDYTVGAVETGIDVTGIDTTASMDTPMFDAEMIDHFV